MKAISLLQPWATLVALKEKRIETRSWATKYRGPLAIHASKRFPTWAKELCFTEPFKTVLFHAGIELNELPRGAVIATCNLVDCIEIISGNLIPQPERSFGDYTPGRYAWLLGNVKPLPEPISVRGQLGLWEWEPPEGLL